MLQYDWGSGISKGGWSNKALAANQMGGGAPLTHLLGGATIMPDAMGGVKKERPDPEKGRGERKSTAPTE